MLSNQFDKVGAVILAAGQGKRMKSGLPKVLHQLEGQPIINFSVSAVESLGLRPTIVVSNDNKDVIRKVLGNRVDFAVQEQQLGTGHAVLSAEILLEDNVEHLIVLYGDHPYLTGDSLKKLIEKHLENGNTITMMTTIVPDYKEWRGAFYGFGRIVRGENGHIEKIVERKDAPEDVLAMKEINPGYYCFKASWLWKNLKNLKNDNAQEEYYLTDLVKYAVNSGEKISSIEINPKEALGVNSPEDLQSARELFYV